MKKNILITGVAGFIGSNLADMLLKKNFNVTGIDNLSYGVLEQIPKGVNFYQEDIRDKDIYKLFSDDNLLNSKIPLSFNSIMH